MSTQSIFLQTYEKASFFQMDELDWDEKDLNDFIAPQVCEEQENSSPKLNPSRKQLSRMTYGKDYPYDIWFRIGTFIAPENIGKFALISRTTHQIVNSVAFWIAIFKRYNKLEVRRFSRLLSKEHLSIVRIHVIKSLYENYPPFQARVQKISSIQIDPHFLVSSRCIRLWYSERATRPISYNYYFELNFHQIQPVIPIQARSPLFSEHTRYMLDKDSCILHVTSPKYVPLGPYMGMILSKLIFNISSDYRYYKLNMWFDSSRVSTLSHDVLNIDPVMSLRVYRWYDIPSNID